MRTGGSPRRPRSGGRNRRARSPAGTPSRSRETPPRAIPSGATRAGNLDRQDTSGPSGTLCRHSLTPVKSVVSGCVVTGALGEVASTPTIKRPQGNGEKSKAGCAESRGDGIAAEQKTTNFQLTPVQKALSQTIGSPSRATSI